MPFRDKGRLEIIDSINKNPIQIKKSDLPEDWSFEAADFVNKLIQKKAENRLGYGGYDEIKNHLWLKSVAWQKIIDKILESPLKTKVKMKQV